MEKSCFHLILLITALLILLHEFNETLMPLLCYENTVLQTGEWWRLLSGHLIHLSWTHLILNLASLWILAITLFQNEKSLTLLLYIFMLATGISFGLLTFSPDIAWYVGMSGVIHGLIVIGATTNFRSNPGIAVLLIIGITAKLLWEQFYSGSHAMEIAIGGKIVSDAHLYGAVSGVIIISLLKLIPLLKYSHNKSFVQHGVLKD